MSATRTRAIRFPGILLCLILGTATTIGIAWAAAAFVPLTPLNQQTQISVTGFGIQVDQSNTSRGWFALPPTSGVVALDGDHVEPWFLRLRRIGAQRTIWFEKGRIYNRSTIGPPGGSSAAVANWSLATDTRDHPRFRRGTLTLPANLQAEIDDGAQPVWGVMEDRRGWPLLALTWQAVAPRYVMKQSAPVIPETYEGIYRLRWVIEVPELVESRRSLADLRALPIMPHWPGLIANVTIFAAAWWLLLFAPRVARLQWRRSRGRCLACGYDLMHDLPAGCPECGWNRAPAEANPDHDRPTSAA